MNKVYFGIDPGKDGFITAFDGSDFTFYEMPTHKVDIEGFLKNGKSKTKTEFNEKGIKDIIKKISLDFPNSEKVFAIEKVVGREGWSAQNNFNFGHTAGLQRMIPIMLDSKYILVRPQTWQSFVRQGYDYIRVPSKSGKTMITDAKAVAEMIVEKEFPNIDFRKTIRSKKNHNGKIDSFLICLHLYRTTNDQKDIVCKNNKNTL